MGVGSVARTEDFGIQRRWGSPAFPQQLLESLSVAGVGKIRLCYLKSQLLVQCL